MDKRSFQELPSVLSSHRIPFQAPAVVSEKVYISPALVALFHNAKSLSESTHPALRLNLYSSLEYSSSVTEIRVPSWRKLISSSSISFSYSVIRWFPRKFVTTDY